MTELNIHSKYIDKRISDIKKKGNSCHKNEKKLGV